MGRREIYFIKAEAIVYLLFLWLDIIGSRPLVSNLLKFSGIVLCFFFVLTKKVRLGRPDKTMMSLAFFFTLLADFCLVLLGCELGGLIFFPIVQILYWYRLETISWKGIGARLFAFGCLAGVLLFSMGFFDVMLVLGSFYMVQIIFNVVLALKHWFWKENRIRRGGFFAVGMVLFLLCDLNVGLVEAAQYVSMESGVLGVLFPFASIAVWTFYLPSQVLIALSCED